MITPDDLNSIEDFEEITVTALAVQSLPYGQATVYGKGAGDEENRQIVGLDFDDELFTVVTRYGKRDTIHVYPSWQCIFTISGPSEDEEEEKEEEDENTTDLSVSNTGDAVAAGGGTAITGLLQGQLDTATEAVKPDLEKVRSGSAV